MAVGDVEDLHGPGNGCGRGSGSGFGPIVAVTWERLGSTGAPVIIKLGLLSLQHEFVAMPAPLKKRKSHRDSYFIIIENMV